MIARTPWQRDNFISQLFARFPELQEHQDPTVAGLLHCEMGWFSHKTSDAIEARDFRLVRAHFEFVDEALTFASEELENAILVSYLENVFAPNTPKTAKARDLLTPQLLAPVLEMEGHFIAKVAGTLPPIARSGSQGAANELEQRLRTMSGSKGRRS
jgi:hypothetical protein